MNNINPKSSNTFDSNKEGIKIVKVAAFCFALISWVATAKGLHEYVFTDKYWQALLISFGIQSILFVFNLKLPEYFKTIGDKSENRIKRKYKFGDNKGNEKTTYKWSFYQRLIAVFYTIMIIASSFFSFVYMTNVAYKNTQYLDANIVLERIYRNYLNDVDQYTNELTKVTQLTISNILSKFEADIESDNTEEAKTKSELEEDVNNAQNYYDKMVIEENSLQEEYNSAKKNYETPMSERWRDSYVYAQEKAEYDDARIRLKTAKDNTADAKKALEMAKKSLKEYKPTMNLIIQDMLIESLKPVPDSQLLNDLMTNLYDVVIKSSETNIETTDFATIVTNTKELSIAINNYVVLQNICSTVDNDYNIQALKQQILNENIEIPNPSSNDFETEKIIWENEWKKRFVVLEKIIISVPKYTDYSAITIENINEIIDTDTLQKFNAEDMTKNIDEAVRNNLANINAIERAVKKLYNNYPFLAWFSFGLAIFLDIASLLAGLFIFLTDKAYSKKKTITVTDTPKEE